MSRVWLITGSSRGLGREIGQAALAAGNSVVATARCATTLGDLVNKYPDQVLAVSLDVTDRIRAAEVVREAVDAFGPLDVVVNNAGYANIDSIEDFSEDDFRAQIETNLWGTINVTRAALPVLRGQRSGHIIQISSVGGRARCGRRTRRLPDREVGGGGLLGSAAEGSSATRDPRHA